MTSPSNPVSWEQLFDAWPLIEADFQQVYGVDLEHAIRTRSWRWFAVRCMGLLSSPDTRIHRRFAPTEDDEPSDDL